MYNELIADLKEISNWIVATASTASFSHDELNALHYADKVRDGADLIEQQQALIERLQAEVPAWISVEERLPEKSGQYLTYNEFGWFNAYSYSIIHKQWNTQDWMSEKSAKGLGINSITHWMPLPKPPEVKQ